MVRTCPFEVALAIGDPSSLEALDGSPPPTSLLPSMLLHQDANFRDYAWQHGDHKLIPAVELLLWEGLSEQLALDFVAHLSLEYLYQSYFYQDQRSPRHVAFLRSLAPDIGYPSLDWAATTDDELLLLALENPRLSPRELDLARQWVGANEETAREERLLACHAPIAT